MKKPIGVGIVGYGKVATRTHRKWIQEKEGIDLVAVCDTAEARRKAAQEDDPDIGVYADFGEFLDDAALDLVIVTTTPNTHCELAVQACGAGKHVFVDKPFAMNLAQAEQMLMAASRAGVVIHCHQSRRYDPEYLAIVAAVAEGRIGEVTHVRRVWSQYGESWASWGIEGFNPTWRIQREYGGGMVYDYAPHCGDQILRLVDKPLRQVFADVRSLKFSSDADDHFSCVMRFEGGATAYLEASNLTLLPAPHWYVVGTAGCITADAVGSSITVLSFDKQEAEIRGPIHGRDELYDNLIDCIAGNAKPNVTPDQLRESMKLIDAIFSSGKKGSAVEL